VCGICGFAFADPSRPPQQGALEIMSELVRHRGPDSGGFYEGPGVGLGFRRLSIIDLETGDQPVSSENQAVTLICNGEIYNFVELRRELTHKGHHFRTRSDVEVIIHLYEDHGPNCVHFLRGMFGFALWDNRIKRLMLARDRLGIKPLHYALTTGAVYFGSEQKAILGVAEEVDRSIDVKAVRDLLAFGYLPGVRTLCRGIRRLPPAHFLLYHEGSSSLHRYWEPTFPEAQEREGRRSTGEWAAELREKVTESVRIHMRSDVPVGAWLSPGIDSSAVVAIASRFEGAQIKSVTLGFEDPNLDETSRFPTLDRYPGFSIDNRVIACESADLEMFPQALWHCEEPTHVMIPQMILSKAASQRVKVVLTGEGSDEIMGGYHWYKHDKLLGPFARLPLGIRRLMMPVLRRLPRWNAQMTRLHLAPAGMNLRRYSAMHGPVVGALDNALLAPEFQREMSDDEEPPLSLPTEFHRWRPFQQLQYLDLTIRLPEFITHGLDRASMAFGLEARVPFLDHELVEFCSRIPPSLKMRGFREKYILREALRGILPEEIRTRKKHPLSAPLQHWWRRTLPQFAEDALSQHSLCQKGYFQSRFVKDLLDRHRRFEGNYASHLSTVLAVQMWEGLFRSASTTHPAA
jgi:asparagine synthase (glutamine-hydrolysing)